MKYDVIVDIPSREDLKPGMTAEVDLLLASYQQVLTAPVAAVADTADGVFCWVEQNGDYVKRSVLLGDGNDIFVIVSQGLEPGDEVVLAPVALLKDSELDADSPAESATNELPQQTHSGETPHE